MVQNKIKDIKPDTVNNFTLFYYPLTLPLAMIPDIDCSIHNVDDMNWSTFVSKKKYNNEIEIRFPKIRKVICEYLKITGEDVYKIYVTTHLFADLHLTKFQVESIIYLLDLEFPCKKSTGRINKFWVTKRIRTMHDIINYVNGRWNLIYLTVEDFRYEEVLEQNRIKMEKTKDQKLAEELKCLIEQFNIYQAYLQRIADKGKEMREYVEYLAENFKDKENVIYSIYRQYRVFSLNYFNKQLDPKKGIPKWTSYTIDGDGSFNYYNIDTYRGGCYY